MHPCARQRCLAFRKLTLEHCPLRGLGIRVRARGCDERAHGPPDGRIDGDCAIESGGTSAGRGKVKRIE
jgi:hypothetical protein